MKTIFGPTYRYDGEILNEPTLLYVKDHYYDEENHCFHVKKLLENSSCSPDKHLIVLDHALRDDSLTEYNHLYFPIFLATECKEFLKENISVNWQNKKQCFNFMINKPRLHREFLLMLIQHFGLSKFSYSLPWRETSLSGSTMLSLTDNAVYRDIISSNQRLTIPTTNYVFGPEVTMGKGVRNGSFRNSQTYDRLLKIPVFESSCISLVTEPCFFEHTTMITEKTLMSIYAGTIPIWVGGWGIPDYLSKLGFDLFEDLVDHSYQFMPDPFDRCYYAIEKNLTLLDNFEFIHEFVMNNQSRLQHNLDLIKQNPFYLDVVNKINQYRDQNDFYIQLLNIAKGYRNNIFANINEVVDSR